MNEWSRLICVSELYKLVTMPKTFQHHLIFTSCQTSRCQPPQAAIDTLQRRLAVMAAERDALAHTGATADSATATGAVQSQPCSTAGSQTDVASGGGAQACSSCAGMRWVSVGHEFRVQSLIHDIMPGASCPWHFPSATTWDTRICLVLGIFSAALRFLHNQCFCLCETAAQACGST